MRLQHDLMSLVICRLRVFKRLCPNTNERTATEATNISTLYLKFHRELIIELVPSLFPKIGVLSMPRGFGFLNDWNELWNSCIFLNVMSHLSNKATSFNALNCGDHELQKFVVCIREGLFDAFTTGYISCPCNYISFNPLQ